MTIFIGLSALAMLFCAYRIGYCTGRIDAARELLKRRRPVRSDKDLPQVEDMVGIWNLGEPGDKYIRRMRDG